MKIRFRCPSDHRLSVPESWAGRQVRCAKCKRTVYVPRPAGGAPSQPVPKRPPQRQPRSKRSLRPPKLMPAGVYRPDAGKVSTVRSLALLLGLAVALSLYPLVYFSFYPAANTIHLNLATAPGWARMVILMAAMQGFYIAWMLNRPDWSSVWVVMLVFAGVAAIYGAATAIAIATPAERPMPLGMGPVRHTAGSWCVAVLLVMSLATYLCGRTSAKWRRAIEQETPHGRIAPG